MLKLQTREKYYNTRGGPLKYSAVFLYTQNKKGEGKSPEYLILIILQMSQEQMSSRRSPLDSTDIEPFKSDNLKEKLTNIADNSSMLLSIQNRLKGFQF